ncbi:unnamed protein product [Brugia pahangi]|uniref:Secreted protein n=1 Tax=Brugia pahangi TaxID=6280 RepID=A0A0N4TC44_BRUPA|nr:unnamed protein product [Brugia pahangi]
MVARLVHVSASVARLVHVSASVARLVHVPVFVAKLLAGTNERATMTDGCASLIEAISAKCSNEWVHGTLPVETTKVAVEFSCLWRVSEELRYINLTEVRDPPHSFIESGNVPLTFTVRRKLVYPSSRQVAT